MKLRLILITAALGALLALGGCSSAHLVKQADLNERAANVAQDSAVDIQSILTKYPPGTIEDGQLATLIRGILPASQVPKFDQMIAIGGNVRASAQILANDLPTLAQTLRDEAADLRADAAANDSRWNNTLDSITSAATSVGGIAGILGALAGVWFKRGKDQAVQDADSIVKGINIIRESSPEADAIFSTDASLIAKSQLTTGAAKLIQKNKPTT